MAKAERLVADNLTRAAAELLVDQLSLAAGRRGVASFVLAGGSTPLALYDELAGPRYTGRVPWDRVHFFWGDERLVPPDDPACNFRAAWETGLGDVPIPVGNVHRIRGELDATASVADYTEQLRAWAAIHDPGAPHPWPRFDVVLLGLGEDGHTASLFPGSPVEADSPVIAVTADYQGRPAGRATLTPLAFNDARNVYFLVSGANKAEAVYQTLHSDDPVGYPAQRIRPIAGRVTWLLDRAAAGLL